MKRPFLEFPLLKRELVGLLRTRRAFWLLFIAVALSTLLPLLGWPQGQRAAWYAYENTAVFMVFFMTQLSVALLIIPAFTAGAISGEREQNTYDLLYTTLLSPWSIVFSKVLAATGYVLLLLLASAPSVCVLYLLGGLGLETILQCYLATFLAVLHSGLICLTASMRSRRTSHAVVRGMVWVVFWNGGLLMLLGLVLVLLSEGLGLFRVSGIEEFLVFLLGLSPYSAIGFAIFPEMPTRMVAVSPFQVYLLYAGLLSLGHFLYLLRRVRVPDLVMSRRRERRLARKGASGSKRIRRPLFSKLLLALGEGGFPLLRSPMFLKEIRSEFFGRVWYQRLIFWVPLVIFILLTLIDKDLDAKVLPVGEAALALLVLIAPGVAASAIPREIEHGNLDFLRGTLLPLRAILRGKFLAGLASVFGLLLAAGLVLLVSPHFSRAGGWGNPPPRHEAILWCYLVSALVLPLALLFTVSVACFFSVICRRTLGALLGSYLTLLGIFLLFPLVATLLWGLRSGQGRSFFEIFLPAANPFMAYGVCIEGFLHNRNVKDVEAVLGLFVFFHAAGSLALLALSNRLLERLRLRDR
ncbi:MAG: hypothetical protein HY717_01230 [Planctomycetes bacterium]|nr:hypothetical protein [Planctomycetota bacterium]